MVVVLVCATAALAMAGPQDSIGTKVKNGKIFILHKVEKAQGLFSISRRYGVPLKDIIAANPGSDQVLHIDQILMIPTGKDAPMEEKAVKKYFSEDKGKSTSGSGAKRKNSTFAKYHTVAKGETLYSISVLYKTKVDVIKNLNGLKTDVLSVGQQIMVPATEEEKKVHDTKVADAKAKVDTAQGKSKEIKKTLDPNLETEPKVDIKEVSASKYEIKVEKLPKYDVQKISEKGVSELYTGEVNSTNLRVCSHHVARVGTTIMVTNPLNQKSVFVKVVSNHSLDTEEGNIIQLSPTAMNDIQLASGDLVEVSFAR
jgi:LysM repeat protein